MITKKKKLYYYLIFIKLIIIYFYFIILYYSVKTGIHYKKKLIWKNGKANIKKVKEEIRYYENISISFSDIKYRQNISSPKISLIIPVYNQEKYLIPLYISIQNQSLKDIEIIFVDDASTDNSNYILQKISERDKRIITLKNKINKRTFYSRKLGGFYSKGEYVLIIDPDDLLLNNILEKAYKTAKYYNIDILQYYIIFGDYRNNNVWKELKCQDGIIYYPLTIYIFCYCGTRNLWDKLIKRDIFIKSIDFMGEKYNYDRFETHDDDTSFYGLINVIKSFGFLEDIGYFYNKNNLNSATFQLFKPRNINKIFQSLFVIMKYFYEKSKNDRFHKKYIAYSFFFNKVFIPYRNKIKYLTRGFFFINKVLNQYISCKYFEEEEKKNLIIFKKEINSIQIAKNK